MIKKHTANVEIFEQLPTVSLKEGCISQMFTKSETTGCTLRPTRGNDPMLEFLAWRKTPSPSHAMTVDSWFDAVIKG